jgi:DNA-binding NarL/FixJ family response regulator
MTDDGKNSTLRVLIADDSALLRGRLTTLLSEVAGTELVGQASDALEALETIERLKPDVVILDIRMPQGNGITVLETLKANEDCPVIIMLTAFPYPQYREKCIKAGADYFFDKATEFDLIVQALEQLKAKVMIEIGKERRDGK